MYSVTGLDNGDGFLGVAVDNGYLAGITQGYCKEVINIAFVLWFAWTVFGFNQKFPAVNHFRHSPLWRCRWLVLQETRHDTNLGFGQVT